MAQQIEFTDDSTENIRRMLPHLDEESREKISLVIFGTYLSMPNEGFVKDQECVERKVMDHENRSKR